MTAGNTNQRHPDLPPGLYPVEQWRGRRSKRWCRSIRCTVYLPGGIRRNISASWGTGLRTRAEAVALVERKRAALLAAVRPCD